MNRLIERARKRAWHLAFLAEVADLEGRPARIMMTRMEVNQIANVINDLQREVVWVRGQANGLAAKLMAVEMETRGTLFGESMPTPYGAACASALALGLQMVMVKHLAGDLLEKALAVNEKLREVVETNERLCEQLVRLKAENEDFLTMRDDAFRGRKDAEAENRALREQVEEWKRWTGFRRKYEAKVYHNE